MSLMRSWLLIVATMPFNERIKPLERFLGKVLVFILIRQKSDKSDDGAEGCD